MPTQKIPTIENLTDEAATFRAKAEALLPSFFHREQDEKPSNWDGDQWTLIQNGLRSLIDSSHHRVNWNPELRDLQRWQREAENIQKQLNTNPKPDAAGSRDSAPNVASVLMDRILKIAEQQ